MESTVVATAMPVIMSPVDEASELWLSQSRRDVCNTAKLSRQERTPALAGGAREARKVL